MRVNNNVLVRMAIKELRRKRLAEEISATLLARRAGINRSRLSFLECGHLHPSDEELRRLEAALGELSAARARVREVAVEVGL